MLRTAFYLVAALALGDSALAAERVPTPHAPALMCEPLAKLSASFDNKTHVVPLTQGQFHFAQGLYVGSPTTPDGLPPGTGASLATHDGTPNGMLIWTRGALACNPTAVDDKLIKFIKGIKTGTLDAAGDEL